MRAVVITGASTGIGRACALALDAKGFRVFAGVRKSSDGDGLRSAGSKRIEPVHIDVTLPESIGEMTEAVTAMVGETGLAGVVNNAGTTLPCPVEYLSIDSFRSQLEVNLTGPLAVTRSLLPLLCRARGRVVNITSVAGRVGTPLMAGYVAAKHGLEGLSDVLRLELGQRGIHVAVVEPGYISTAMRRKLERDTQTVIDSLPEDGRRRYAGQLTRLAQTISDHAANGSPPDVVAHAVVHALTAGRPRTRYPVGAGARRLLLLRKLLPDRRFDRLILRVAHLGRPDPS